MAKFTADTTFRDGYDTFEEGGEYDEPLGRVARFAAAGWATPDDAIEGLAPSAVDASALEVDDVVEGNQSLEA